MTEAKKIKVAEFKAPEGNYRQYVKDAMLEMYNFEWSPNESFDITWKGEVKFGIKLGYSKDTKYMGIPFGDTKANYSQFIHYVKDGVFTPNSIYYEEMLGNNCGSAVIRALSKLIDLQYSGAIRPSTNRGTMLKLAGNLKQPTEFGTGYDTVDVWTANSKNDVFEAYATLDMGDVLYKTIKKKAGHVRMISLPSHVERFENGLIDPENSYVTTLEQTNAIDKTRTDGVTTTWWIDHTYTFNALYDTKFMPITPTIYTSGEVAKDVYLMFDGENTAEDLKAGKLKGEIKCTFPLIFVRGEIVNEKGEIVKTVEKYNFLTEHAYDSSVLNEELAISALEKGKYTFTLTAGTSRGTVDFEVIPFEI